jgi:hypothetical protein
VARTRGRGRRGAARTVDAVVTEVLMHRRDDRGMIGGRPAGRRVRAGGVHDVPVAAAEPPTTPAAVVRAGRGGAGVDRPRRSE